MMRLSGWGGVGLVVLGMACAQSERPDWTAACFESRELGAWDERWQRPCVVESDRDLDGEIDARTVTEIDAHGRVVARVSETELVPAERWEYDDFGRVLVHEQDDGRAELSFREEHDYDADGKLIQTRFDTDGDGVIDIVATHEYESCGLPELWVGLLACTVEYDVDDDGDIDGVSTSTWNDDGQLEAELKYDPTTRVTVAVSYARNADGNTDRTETDIGNDGTVDRIEGTDFDSGGAQLRNWLDDDADGTRDEWVEFVRSPDGSRSVAIGYDREGEVSRRVSEYDEQGYIIRFSVRDERTPEADYDSVYRYDSAGNPIATARDFYPYGSADECHYISYACWVE